MPGTLESDHEDVRRAAHEAEARYLVAVKMQGSVETLVELACYAQDCWLTAAKLCALGEDSARARMQGPTLRRQFAVLEGAWSDARNWAVLGEDAASRGELLGALAAAHRAATNSPVPVPFPVEDARTEPVRLVDVQPGSEPAAPLVHSRPG